MKTSVMTLFKNALIILIISNSLLFLQSNTVKGQTDYFEGVIEYKIEYDTKNFRYSKSMLSEIYGSKVISKFKDGNFRDEYYNDQGKLVRTSILNLEAKTYYYDLNGFDTLYYSDIDKTDYETSIQQLDDMHVLGSDCWVIKSTSVKKNDSNLVPVVLKFFYSKELKLNPEWYSEYIDGAYNEIHKLAPGIEIKTESYGPNFTIIKSMVSKTEADISEEEFRIKTRKLLKKMN
jgi:hypothetical protein